MIAEDCDGIVTGLYEYWACYQPSFPQKTTFIPFPIHTYPQYSNISDDIPKKIKLFIGISKSRSEYKGTDIMLKAAQAIAQKYPNQVELRIAEGVPFARICRNDEWQRCYPRPALQLYSKYESAGSHGKGIICIGGGEPENYEIIHEEHLRPIINVLPNYESVYQALEHLVLHPELIPLLKRQSIEYISKHHDYIKVAKRYEAFYQEKS